MVINHKGVSSYRNSDLVRSILSSSKTLVADKPTTIGSHYDGSASLDGDIAEVIVYNRTLTKEEREQIERYLRQKWGLVNMHLDQ